MSEVGFSAASPQAEDDALRIADGLARSGRKHVGLLACPSDLDIEPVAISIGAGLATLCEGNVALLDVCGRFRSGPTPEPGDRGSVILGRWLSRSLAVLSPREVLRESGSLACLRCMLDSALRSEWVLVDLGGLPRIEALRALELLDGACVVGRAGRTREKELIALYRELVPSKDLGVILTDG